MVESSSSSSDDDDKDDDDPTTTSTNVNNNNNNNPGRLIATFEQPDDFAQPADTWPFTNADMRRLDESNDAGFYQQPRFVTHIDDRAIAALTDYYGYEFKQQQQIHKGRPVDVLDLCSSWISHLPNGDDGDDGNSNTMLGKVVGVGMNEAELQANTQLTEYSVQDLNQNPLLEQFPDDESFDVICNVVSVDYLTRPQVVFQEIHRLLRPGGVALVSFSNRCFPTKATAHWLQADDIGRLTIVASYFYHCGREWQTIEAFDIIPTTITTTPPLPTLRELFQSPSKGFAWMSTAAAVQRQNTGDPMYVVRAVKQ